MRCPKDIPAWDSILKFLSANGRHSESKLPMNKFNISKVLKGILLIAVFTLQFAYIEWKKRHFE